MANRARMIDSILQKLRNINPEFVAGMDKAVEYGEGYTARSRNFNDGAYARPAMNPLAEDDAGSHIHMGYGGAFKQRAPVLDEAGNPMFDRQGRQLFDKGNRLYDEKGNVVGFFNQGDRIQTQDGVPYRSRVSGEASPTGANFGLGYTAGRIGASFGGNADLSKYWKWNHPLGVASDVAQHAVKQGNEAKGNRAMTPVTALLPSIILGASAGNVELSSLSEGDVTGRARGTQAVERKRRADGTLDPDAETETANAVLEVAQRYILGRSGKLLTDYADYADDKLAGGEIPVDEWTYRQSKARQFEPKGIHNAFGLIKFDPTSAINDEATITQLGYSTPLSGATAFGGSMIGAGAMGTLMKQENIGLLNRYPKGGRGRGAVSALLTAGAMGAGALIGKAGGVVANDALQQQINPRNAEFQDNIRKELNRRKQAQQE